MSFPDVTNQYFVKKQFVLFCVLWFIHFAGNLVFRSKPAQKVLVIKAIVDNITHLCIGVISWLIFMSHEKLSFRLGWESLVCGVLASLIDLDHFVAAKSFRLQDAVSLHSRPPLHNTTLVVCLTLLFTALAFVFENRQAQKVGWLLAVAFVSHHLRDALHRGLYLWPYAMEKMSFLHVLLCSYFFPLGFGLLACSLKLDADVTRGPDFLIV